jgi:hypothetical protein
MGNCLGQGAKTWAVDDEWDRFEPTSRELLQHQKEASPPRKGDSTMVKINLTRKQLEEILGQSRLNTDRNLPIELLLKHAIQKRCEESIQDRSRQWRPVLKTIPEAAE